MFTRSKACEVFIFHHLVHAFQGGGSTIIDIISLRIPRYCEHFGSSVTPVCRKVLFGCCGSQPGFSANKRHIAESVFSRSFC